MNSPKENGHAGVEQLFSLLTKKPQIDLRQYWFIFLRRKWWGISISFLVTLGSAIYAWQFIRPMYEASSTIQVLPSRLLNRSVREVTPGVSDNVDYRELQRKILSTEYLLQLVQRLDLAKNEETLARAKELQARNNSVPFDELVRRLIVEQLRQSIAVTVVSGSKLFQVSVQNESPQAAYHIAKTLTDIFIDESKNNELRGIRGVREFSNEQLAIYQAKVDEAEENLRRFKERQASSRAQNIGNAGNIQPLRELINTTASTVSDRQRRLAQLEQLLPAGTAKPLWNEDAELARLKAQINAKMEDFKRSTRVTTLQGNYEMTLNNEVTVLRQECQRVLVGLIPRLYPRLDATAQQTVLEHQMGQIDLYILSTRSAMANEVLKSLINLATAEPTDQLELQRLEEEVEKNRRVYDLFFEQSRGTQIEEALQNSDANFKYLLIEPARVPITPVGGNKTQFVVFSFVVSLGLGLVVIFGLEALDQSIRSVEDVEQYLGLPVWGIVPKITMPFKTWHDNLKKLSGMQGRGSVPPTSTPMPSDSSVKS